MYSRNHVNFLSMNVIVLNQISINHFYCFLNVTLSHDVGNDFEN